MKLRIALTLCPAILALSLVASGAQPLARLSISSFDELSNSVIRVAGAVAPESRNELGPQLTGKLGLTNMATFDAKRPWELAVWHHSDSPAPLVALKGPIADVKKFHSALDSEGLLATLGQDWVQLEKGSAVIVFKAADTQSDAEKEELKRWEQQSTVAPARTVELTLAPSEAARAQVLPLLGIARMSVSQGAAAAAGGANQKAMGEMFDLYFDGIETFVKGFQEFKLAAGATTDSLMLEETISAKPGSDLAKWFRKPAHPLTAEDVGSFAPDALASGALTLDKNAQLIELTRKFLRLSFALQNQATNDPAMESLVELMSKFLPVRVSGSVFMKGHVEFSGVYRFPESDAAALYAEMKPLLARLVKSQAGEGKMYSAASFTEKHHTVGNIPVDRYSLTLNLDNPLFKQPGQQETLKAIWSNGKMEFDYAVKNGQLLVASPERMQALIEGSAKPEGASPFVTDDSTVAAGYFNVLTAVRDFAGTNPMIPEGVKEQMAKLKPQGTAIRFQLEMNNQVRVEQRVPLKLLEQLGHLKD